MANLEGGGKMTEKRTWGGRFDGGMDQLTQEYTAGLDRDFWAHDITGSIAHARMLGKQGIIPAAVSYTHLSLECAEAIFRAPFERQRHSAFGLQFTGRTNAAENGIDAEIIR